MELVSLVKGKQMEDMTGRQDEGRPTTSAKSFLGESHTGVLLQVLVCFTDQSAGSKTTSQHHVFSVFQGSMFHLHLWLK